MPVTHGVTGSSPVHTASLDLQDVTILKVFFYPGCLGDELSRVRKSTQPTAQGAQWGSRILIGAVKTAHPVRGGIG